MEAVGWEKEQSMAAAAEVVYCDGRATVSLYQHAEQQSLAELHMIWQCQRYLLSRR